MEKWFTLLLSQMFLCLLTLQYPFSFVSNTETEKQNMKSIAAITILASSAAAFAPTPVSRVESSLSYAKELDSMFGTTVETGGRVVCIYYVLLCIVCYLNLFISD